MSMDEMIHGQDYPSPMQASQPLHRESLTIRLSRQAVQLQTQLKKVNEALTLLEKNPDLQKLLDVVSEVG